LTADSLKREVLDLLARQTAWQQSRRRLTWAEKIRLVEAIRASILTLRKSAPPRP